MLTNKRADFIFIFLLGLYLTTTFVVCITSNFVISINNYLAIGGWVAVLIVRIKKERKGRYALVFLLLLALLQLLNFSVGSTGLQFALGSMETNLIGFDIILLLFNIAFYMVNRQSVNRVIRRLIDGNEKEQALERQKKIDFYKKRFEEFDNEQLKAAYRHILDYPDEAQVVIQELISMQNQQY
jgi:predicted membrane channel-forming protein YqfA (hemolysin III family)